MDIEEAIRNVWEVFQLKGAQLSAFAKGISRPLMAVCWNSLEDDREEKETMLSELVGDYVGIE